MHLVDAVVLATELDQELIRQVLLLRGLNYSVNEIAESLSIGSGTALKILDAADAAFREMPPMELAEAAYGSYLVANSAVADELVSLYQDLKKNYEAHKQGLTRHPDGTPVLKAYPKDMIQILQVIDAQAARNMQAKMGVFKVKMVTRVKVENKQLLDSFSPAELTDAFDAPIDVTSKELT